MSWETAEVTHQNFTSQTTTTPGVRSRRPRLLTAVLTTACATAALVALPVQTEVASATPSAISAVGAPYDAVNTPQLTVSSQTAGDLMVLSFFMNGTTVATTVTSVTGGGVKVWKEDTVYSEDGYLDEVWWGVVSTPSSGSTVTLTVNGAYLTDEVVAQEFTAGSGVSWVPGETGHRLSATTTMVFPKLDATTPESLYFGFAYGTGIASAGSTPGFTYWPTQADNMLAWDPNVSGTVTPTATETTDGAASIAALFTAYRPPPPPPPYISALAPLYSAQNATSLPVSPEALGDLMVLAVAFNGGTSGATVTSVSGGGVGTWAKSNTIQQNGEVIQLWWGVVSTTGPFTVDLSTTGTFVTEEVVAQEFYASSRGTWGVAGLPGQAKSATSTVLFPNLTATSSPELYFGYAVVAGVVLSGCTTGFTYAMTPDDNLLCWDPDYSGSKGPAASQSSQGSEALASLFAV
jgi:hypothetical protein